MGTALYVRAMEAIPLLTQLSTVPTKVARSTTKYIQQLVEKQQSYKKIDKKQIVLQLYSHGEKESKLRY